MIVAAPRKEVKMKISMQDIINLGNKICAMLIKRGKEVEEELREYYSKCSDERFRAIYDNRIKYKSGDIMRRLIEEEARKRGL